MNFQQGTGPEKHPLRKIDMVNNFISTAKVILATSGSQFYKVICLNALAAAIDLTMIVTVVTYITLETSSSLPRDEGVSNVIAQILSKSDGPHAALAIILIALFFRVMSTYFTFRFLANFRSLLAKRLVDALLQFEYKQFQKRKSGELTGSLLSELDLVLQHVIRPVLLGANAFFLLFVFGAFLVISVPRGVILISILGSIYCLIFLYYARKQSHLGKVRSESNAERHSSLTELIRSFKIIKIFDSAASFKNRFVNAQNRFSISSAQSDANTQYPNIIVEGALYLGIVAYLYIKSQTGLFGEADWLTSADLAVGIFALIKIRPSLATIFSMLSHLRVGAPSLKSLNEKLIIANSNEGLFSDEKGPSFEKVKTLELKNVTFSYHRDGPELLSGVSAVFNAGEIVGITGPSGVGKSTLLDLIVGFYFPTNGAIVVNGQEVERSDVQRFQSCVGLVSQDVVLFSGSLADNVALSKGEIDFSRVESCLRSLGLVEIGAVPVSRTSLPDIQLEENGKNLSGGQRQRIGIARAFYKRPSVLILDEATSGLDDKSVDNVFNALKANSRNIVTIVVSHQPKVLNLCDRIVKLEKGTN